MICIKADIPKELNDIDDELKAIYHSKDTVCFHIFKRISNVLLKKPICLHNYLFSLHKSMILTFFACSRIADRRV